MVNVLFAMILTVGFRIFLRWSVADRDWHKARIVRIAPA
ncbi:hypothetical protein C100_01335 [Sphingobium sp. C100]|nr:hypothetical protein C100_01335 [Sphingobium sp. C100]